MKFQVILHEAEEGGYWAEVSELPGCVSQGETREEALANLREAAEGSLEEMTSKLRFESAVPRIRVSFT